MNAYESPPDSASLLGLLVLVLLCLAGSGALYLQGKTKRVERFIGQNGCFLTVDEPSRYECSARPYSGFRLSAKEVELLANR